MLSTGSSVILGVIMIDRYPDLDIINIEQGTDEWMSARIGSVGSSDVRAVFASGRGGGPSRGRQALLERKVRESYTGLPETWGETSATRWGHYYEDEARAWFEAATEISVTQVGIVRNKQYPGAHDCPDGLIFTPDGIFWLEIKCLQLGNHKKYVKQSARDGWGCPSEYILQCRHHSVILGAGQGYCLGGFFLLYYPEDKLYEDTAKDSTEWTKILRYVPPPNMDEIELHTSGLYEFVADYNYLRPRAADLVAMAQKKNEQSDRAFAKISGQSVARTLKLIGDMI